MNSNFDEYYVKFDKNKNKNKNKNKYKNKNDVNKKDKILINCKRDSRYACKNRRIVNKDWKDFNDSQSTPTEAHWYWDLSFDWDSIYLDYSPIQASPVLTCASPALTCASSSSYLKSFDITWVEL